MKAETELVVSAARKITVAQREEIEAKGRSEVKQGQEGRKIGEGETNANQR